jgi:hypothetical protein
MADSNSRLLQPSRCLFGAAFALAGLNVLLATRIALHQGDEAAAVLGYVIGAVLIPPMLVIALLGIFQRFRSPRARAQIMLWSSLGVLLTLLLRLGGTPATGS